MSNVTRGREVVDTAHARRWDGRRGRTVSGLHPATHLAVSRQTVNAIETGKYDPSLPLAFQIARLFALPIEAIFFPSELRQETATTSTRWGWW